MTNEEKIMKEVYSSVSNDIKAIAMRCLKRLVT